MPSSSAPAHGTDAFGDWTGGSLSFAPAEGDPKASSESHRGAVAAVVTFTFKQYPSEPSLAVATAAFPRGVDTAGCGTNTDLSTRFPAFDTSAAMAASLHTVSWRGGVIATTAAALGLGNLGANGL